MMRRPKPKMRTRRIATDKPTVMKSTGTDPDPELTPVIESEEEPVTELPESRSRRSRSAAPIASASVPGMSVGQVRRALNQIRKAGSAIRPEHLLFNGITAGKFALLMIQGKGTRKPAAAKSEPEETEIGQDEQPIAHDGEREEYFNGSFATSTSPPPPV